VKLKHILRGKYSHSSAVTLFWLVFEEASEEYIRGKHFHSFAVTLFWLVLITCGFPIPLISGNIDEEEASGA